MSNKELLKWLETEKYYKEQFELWLLKLPAKNTRLIWFGGIPEENAIVLKFQDQNIRITVPDKNDKDAIFFVQGKTSWDTFVNDYIMNNENIHFHKVLDKLLETIIHYYRKDLLQSGKGSNKNGADRQQIKAQQELCGQAMLRLEPILVQARDVLKEEKQYKLDLDMQNCEWVFQFPIHDVISEAVSKAILLDKFLPIKVSLKLQLKFDGTGNTGDLSVLRVEAFQERGGKDKNTSVHLRDTVWDFVEKNWGRIQYWMKFGKGSTLMFSTKTSHIISKKPAAGGVGGGGGSGLTEKESTGHQSLRRSRSSGRLRGPSLAETPPLMSNNEKSEVEVKVSEEEDKGVTGLLKAKTKPSSKGKVVMTQKKAGGDGSRSRSHSASLVKLEQPSHVGKKGSGKKKAVKVSTFDVDEKGEAEEKGKEEKDKKDKVEVKGEGDEKEKEEKDKKDKVEVKGEGDEKEKGKEEKDKKDKVEVKGEGDEKEKGKEEKDKKDKAEVKGEGDEKDKAEDEVKGKGGDEKEKKEDGTGDKQGEKEEEEGNKEDKGGKGKEKCGDGKEDNEREKQTVEIEKQMAKEKMGDGKEQDMKETLKNVKEDEEEDTGKDKSKEKVEHEATEKDKSKEKVEEEVMKDKGKAGSNEKEEKEDIHINKDKDDAKKKDKGKEKEEEGIEEMNCKNDNEDLTKQQGKKKEEEETIPKKLRRKVKPDKGKEVEVEQEQEQEQEQEEEEKEKEKEPSSDPSLLLGNKDKISESEESEVYLDINSVKVYDSEEEKETQESTIIVTEPQVSPISLSEPSPSPLYAQLKSPHKTQSKGFRAAVSDFFSSLTKKKHQSSPSLVEKKDSSLMSSSPPSAEKTPRDSPASSSGKPVHNYNLLKELEKEGYNLKEEYKPEKLDGKITKHGQELNFAIGLVASVRKRLKNFNNYCIICHVKHSCERVSQKPVVCCEPLCLFRYSDLRVAEHLAECEVCPFIGCSTQDDIADDNHALKLLYPEEEKQAGIPLNKLAQMHRHKYLPQDEFKSFVASMSSHGVKVKKVENILQADLVPRFEKTWQAFREKYPDKKIEPKLCWHGTADQSIEGIRKLGLLVPGRSGNSVGHANDSGWWGKGIYVSPIASYSVSYMRGNRGLFLVSVLMGRHCELGQHERMDGQPAREGYDSHIAEHGKEYILFDEGQVLPCYLIEIDRGGGGYF